MFWVKLSRAQDLGLQFWQTKSNAIIVHQSVPHQCIERVVGDDGGRIIFQRILTPKPRPNSKKHVAFAAAAQWAPATATIFGGWHVVRGTGASWKKRSIQSSEIDLRVDGISQEEIYSDKQHMDEVKKQWEKLQDESKSQIMNKDLQKRKYSK